MRIESYPFPQVPPPMPGVRRPAAIPDRAENAASQPEAPLAPSPHETLRRVLEEKRALVEETMASLASSPELGKHIDLRV